MGASLRSALLTPIFTAENRLISFVMHMIHADSAAGEDAIYRMTRYRIKRSAVFICKIGNSHSTRYLRPLIVLTDL